MNHFILPLQESTYETYETLYRKKIQYPENLVSSHAEGLAKAKKEKYIYIGEMTGVTPVAYNDCDYVILKEEFFPSSMGLVFPENSPYIPVFNQK